MTTGVVHCPGARSIAVRLRRRECSDSWTKETHCVRGQSYEPFSRSLAVRAVLAGGGMERGAKRRRAGGGREEKVRGRREEGFVGDDVSAPGRAKVNSSGSRGRRRFLGVSESESWTAGLQHPASRARRADGLRGKSALRKGFIATTVR